MSIPLGLPGLDRPTFRSQHLDQVRAELAPLLDRIATGTLQRELDGALPFEAVRRLKEAGFGALRVPTGVRRPWRHLARADRSSGSSSPPPTPTCRRPSAGTSPSPRTACGSTAARHDQSVWFARFVAGEIAGNAWSEVGSTAIDTQRTVLDPRPTADPSRALDGTKYYTTGSIFAEWADVLRPAATGTAEEDDFAIAIVDTRAAGVTVVDDWDGFGQQRDRQRHDHFDRVRVDRRPRAPVRGPVPLPDGALPAEPARHPGRASPGPRSPSRRRRCAARERNYSHANAARVRDDPQVLARVGEIASRDVRRRGGHPARRRRDPGRARSPRRRTSRDRRRNEAAEIEASAAQVVVTDLVLQATRTSSTPSAPRPPRGRGAWTGTGGTRARWRRTTRASSRPAWWASTSSTAHRRRTPGGSAPPAAARSCPNDQHPKERATMLKFHWFLPTNGGDGRQVVGGGHGVERRPVRSPGAACPTSARSPAAPSTLGFEAALTPTGAWCEDAWLSTAMLSQVSERLKFLVAFRPGLTSPFLAAQMAGTFQNLSGGRLLLNVVTGGESHEQRMFGDFLDKDARYARCDEFLHDRPRAVARRDRRPSTASTSRSRTPCSARSPTRCPRSTSAAPRRPPATSPPGTPTSTSPGASRRRPCARRSTWIRELAADAGPRGPLRHPDAHDHPRHRRGGLGRGRPAARRHRRRRRSRRCRPGCAAASPRASAGCSSSTAAARTTSRSTPTSGPASAWSAAAPAPRWSAATRRSPTGSRSTPTLGIDEFVLSGYPHLEEAYWFGEGVLPVLAERGLLAAPAPRRARLAPRCRSRPGPRRAAS